MGKNLKKIMLIIFVFFISTIFVNAVDTDTNVIIQKVGRGNNNGTYTSRITEEVKGSQEAYLSMEFQRPNDEMYYDIKLKNTGSDVATLKDIKVNVESNNVSYKISGISVGDKIEPNEEILVKINFRYNNSNISKEKSKATISFIYNDVAGNNVVASTGNPNTVDKISKYFVILILSILGIVFVEVMLNKKINLKKSYKYVFILLLTICMAKFDTVMAKTIFGNIKINVDLVTDPIEIWDGQDTTLTSCFTAGTGSSTNPYIIDNVNGLLCFANEVNNGNNYENKYVKLGKSIILNEKSNIISAVENNDYSNLNNWNAIGYLDEENDISVSFDGNFDGNNKTISGIYSDGSMDNAGLFGNVNNANISNLRIDTSIIKSNKYGGSVTAISSNSKFSNIEVSNINNDSKEISGGVVGYSISSDGVNQFNDIIVNDLTMENAVTMGGIIGFSNSEVRFLNADAVVTMNTTEDSDSIGGIIGRAIGDVEVRNTLVKVVSSKNNSSRQGGIVGSAYASAKIYNSSVNKESQIDGISMIAGMIGYANNVIIEDSYNEANINGSSFVAGLVGQLDGKADIKNCYNTGNIYSDIFSSGIVAYTSSNPIEIDNVYNKGNISGKLYVGALISNSNGNVIVKNSYNTGDVICTDFTENGNGVHFSGIVGIASGDNLSIINSYNTGNVKGAYGVGGIVGSSASRVADIKNSYNTGSVAGFDVYNKGMAIGGIVGNGNSGTIIDGCNNSGTVTGINEVGGIIGMYSKILNSYNTGEVNGTFHVGGIVGNGISVDGSYNLGNINTSIDKSGSYTSMYAGGIAGMATSVSNSYNRGVINSITDFVGGIAGDANVTNSYNYADINVSQATANSIRTGGITGCGSATNTFNYGNIKNIGLDDSMISVFTGGIIAMGSVNNSVNMGNIEVSSNFSTSQIGGIAGNGFSNNCVNTGNIKMGYSEPHGALFVGGIVGYNNAVSDNNKTLGLIDVSKNYDFLSTTLPAFVGSVFGVDSGTVDLSNKYVKKDEFFSQYAVGLFRAIANNEQDKKIGQVVSSFDVPDILEIINGDEKFKLDSNNLPILK